MSETELVQVRSNGMEYHAVVIGKLCSIQVEGVEGGECGEEEAEVAG